MLTLLLLLLLMLMLGGPECRKMKVQTHLAAHCLPRRPVFLELRQHWDVEKVSEWKASVTSDTPQPIFVSCLSRR